MSDSLNSGNVRRRKATKSSSVLTFCGVKRGPSLALFCQESVTPSSDNF